MKNFFDWAMDSGNGWGFIIYVFTLGILLIAVSTLAAFFPLTAAALVLAFFVYALYRAIKDYKNES